MIKKYCKWCDKVFYTESQGRVYCSARCHTKSRKTGEHLKKKNKNSLNETIAECNKLGISYAEYQKRQTLERIPKVEGEL